MGRGVVGKSTWESAQVSVCVCVTNVCVSHSFGSSIIQQKLCKHFALRDHQLTDRATQKMVISDQGVLIECDPQMKQFILYLDEKRPLGSKLVLKDLDATHVFVDSKHVDFIKNQVEDLMEQVNYAEPT